MSSFFLFGGDIVTAKAQEGSPGERQRRQEEWVARKKAKTWRCRPHVAPKSWRRGLGRPRWQAVSSLHVPGKGSRLGGRKGATELTLQLSRWLGKPHKLSDQKQSHRTLITIGQVMRVVTPQAQSLLGKGQSLPTVSSVHCSYARRVTFL